jgi:N-acetylglucosamine-6-phosphate deacetylase
MRLFGHLLAPEDRGLAVVDVQGDRIGAIRPTVTPPPGAIGGPDSLIVPGLIDAQVNGAFGQDFSDPSADTGLVRRRLPEFGVTGFVPTIVTSPPDAYGPCLGNLAGPWTEVGSHVLGVHVEGPFLDSGHRGTHTAAWLRDPDPVEASRWLSYGNVRIVTVAPEQPGAEALIRMLASAGVVVSMGHSAATWTEAADGASWGATYGTHLFNAMPPLHHRAPGLAGFLLESHLPVGLIGDGVHLSLDMVRLIARIKAPDEIVLITDALAGLGMPVGRYELAGTESVSDGVVGRQVDGTLSGSLLPLNLAVRNLVDAGIPASTALGFVTSNPARLLGLGPMAGRVVAGATADLVVLDSEWNVEATVIGGSLAYVRGTPPRPSQALGHQQSGAFPLMSQPAERSSRRPD